MLCIPYVGPVIGGGLLAYDIYDTYNNGDTVDWIFLGVDVIPFGKLVPKWVKDKVKDKCCDLLQRMWKESKHVDEILDNPNKNFLDNINESLDDLYKEAEDAVKPYEVGRADDLRRRSIPGDELDIHHVGQAHLFEQTVSGYNRKTGPAIAVPHSEHPYIPASRGDTTMNPRDILAKDINNMRRYTDAPNSSLQELIDLNKKLYPEDLGKK